jgi:hypothetical protein
MVCLRNMEDEGEGCKAHTYIQKPHLQSKHKLFVHANVLACTMQNHVDELVMRKYTQVEHTYKAQVARSHSEQWMDMCARPLRCVCV